MSSNRNMETRSLLDELRSFETGGFLDLGHPLLNRMADSFVKAAGVTFYSLSLSLSLSLSIYIYQRDTASSKRLCCCCFIYRSELFRLCRGRLILQPLKVRSWVLIL
jgi:hypothetical protein